MMHLLQRSRAHCLWLVLAGVVTFSLLSGLLITAARADTAKPPATSIEDRFKTLDRDGDGKLGPNFPTLCSLRRLIPMAMASSRWMISKHSSPRCSNNTQRSSAHHSHPQLGPPVPSRRPLLSRSARRKEGLLPFTAKKQETSLGAFLP